MNAFLKMDGFELWYLAGWTMLHFLWLGTLALIVAATLRILLLRTSAKTRYAAALVCFVIVAAMPIGIAAWVAAQRQAPYLARLAAEDSLTPDFDTSVEPAAAIQSFAPDVSHMEPANSQRQSPMDAVPPSPSTPPLSDVTLETWVRYLPWLWLFGTPLTFVLLATGFVGAERLRRSSHMIQEGPVADACARLVDALRIGRGVSIAVCERIVAPVLVGILRPVILLPPAALTGWSPDEIEMVLLHELAHVRRWDNFVNLLQRIFESLLFFHPAVWLLSHWVRREREACCDAVVIGRTNRPHAYAELLVALAAQMPRSVLFHPAASSALTAGPLRLRIRRILQLEDDPMRVSGKSLALAMSGLLLAATLVVLNLPSHSQAEESAADRTETSVAAEMDQLTLETAESRTTIESEDGRIRLRVEAQSDESDDNTTESSDDRQLFDVPFVVGATRFLAGDVITIDEIRGTAATFEPGNKYWIKGTYRLQSRDQAAISAFTTAKNSAEGTSPIQSIQTTTVSRGAGTFTLCLPMSVLGWPHVSFYPADGGEGFGGVYFGTGDSVLLQWWGSDKAADPNVAGDWPAGVAFPSPEDASASKRAWQTFGIKLVPATTKELQAVGRSQGLKVVGGLPVSPGIKTLVLDTINGEAIQTFDDINRAVDALEGWGGPIAVYCLIETDAEAGELQFQGVSGKVFEVVPGERNIRKFPSLEKQKLADLAYRLLRLELEPIDAEALQRVQALGYDGGVRIVGGQAVNDGVVWSDDILVGLHVWPTISLSEVAEVLERPDLPQLSPLKFYVVRPILLQADAEKWGPDAQDMVVTGRISVNLDRRLPAPAPAVAAPTRASSSDSPIAPEKPSRDATSTLEPNTLDAPMASPKESQDSNESNRKIERDPNLLMLNQQLMEAQYQLSKLASMSKNDTRQKSRLERQVDILKKQIDDYQRLLSTVPPHRGLSTSQVLDPVQVPPILPEELARLRKRGPLRIQFYYSNNAQPCREMERILAAIEKSHTGLLQIQRVNVEEEPALAASLNILHVPTLVFFEDDDQPRQITGSLSMPELWETIRKFARRPSTEDQRANLRYDGKLFDEWRQAWRTELSPKKRIEAVKALAAFGANGYGQEATNAILDVAADYDFTILDSTSASEVQKVVLEVLAPSNHRQVLAQYWLPDLTARLGRDPDKWRVLTIALLYRLRTTRESTLAMLQQLATSEVPTIGDAALAALVRSNQLANGAGQVNDMTRKLLADALTSNDPARICAAMPLMIYNSPVGGGRGRGRGQRTQLMFQTEMMPLLFDGDKAIRQVTRSYLRYLKDEDAPQVVEQLVAVLHDGSRTGDQINAVRALGAMGDKAATATSDLQKLYLRSNDQDILVATLFALLRIDEAGIRQANDQGNLFVEVLPQSALSLTEHFDDKDKEKFEHKTRSIDRLKERLASEAESLGPR